jgi:coproporphyrinogen III oxidase
MPFMKKVRRSMAEPSPVTTSPFVPDRLAVSARAYFEQLQDTICTALEEIDRGFRFTRDPWTHHAGGGGISRVLEGGGVFEKAGVNTSAVSGVLSEVMARRMNVAPSRFHAAGISVVLHPRSPMVPTVHANLRYFQREDGDCWFGGGIDLTPWYPYEEDIVHFHRILKYACEMHGPGLYPRYKRWCDEYFTITHRGETRGVGGVFFDYLRGEMDAHFDFVRSVGDVFVEAYTPIVNRRIHEPYGERELEWQMLRRARYVEFNLVYDRGTLFGLETGGRIESILMSLPPVARWRYNFQPPPGSREAALIDILASPREWVR